MSREVKWIEALWNDADERRPPFPLTNNRIREMEERYGPLLSVLPEEVRREVLYVATSNLGFGEQGANNKGRFIEAIGGKPGQEWCAYFAGYCYERAYERLGFDMPFKRSAGAKRLTKNLGKVGKLFTNPLEAKPGDLVCWSRGRLGWQGHVGVVESVDEDGIIHTIEGNVGRFPAKVKRLTHDVRKERLYRFASLEK